MSLIEVELPVEEALDAIEQASEELADRYPQLDEAECRQLAAQVIQNALLSEQVRMLHAINAKV